MAVVRETASNLSSIFCFVIVHGECVQTSVRTRVFVSVLYFAVVLGKCMQTSVCTLLIVVVNVHSVAH